MARTIQVSPGSPRATSSRFALPTAGSFNPIPFPGGTIKGITLDPTDCQTAYIRDSNGTIWKTPDDGATWQNLTGNLANFSIDPRSIFLAKGATDVLLVGVGKGVINPVTGVPAAASGGIYRLINPTVVRPPRLDSVRRKPAGCPHDRH